MVAEELRNIKNYDKEEEEEEEEEKEEVLEEGQRREEEENIEVSPYYWNNGFP